MLGDAGRPLVASLMQQGGLKAKRGRDGAEMGQMGGACLPSALDGWMLVCASSQRAWLVDGWTVDGGRWTVEGKDGCPLLLAWDAPDLGRANLTGQQTSRQDRTGQGRAATPPPVSFCCPPLPRTTQSPPSGTDFAVTKQEKTPSWQSVARLALPLPCAAVQCAVCSVQCSVSVCLCLCPRLRPRTTSPPTPSSLQEVTSSTTPVSRRRCTTTAFTTLTTTTTTTTPTSSTSSVAAQHTTTHLLDSLSPSHARRSHGPPAPTPVRHCTETPRVPLRLPLSLSLVLVRLDGPPLPVESQHQQLRRSRCPRRAPTPTPTPTSSLDHDPSTNNIHTDRSHAAASPGPQREPLPDSPTPSTHRPATSTLALVS